MTTEQIRYTITVEDKEVASKKRIDHAQAVYDKELENNPGALIRLIDNRTGAMVRTTEKVGLVKRVVNAVKNRATAINDERESVKIAKRAAEKRATRTKFIRNNGDEVAQALVGRSNDEIAQIAMAMLAACNNPKFSNKDTAKIASAATRRNVGSGRMSLGLMIRKYCKHLGEFTTLNDVVARYK